MLIYKIYFIVTSHGGIILCYILVLYIVIHGINVA